MSNKDNKGSRHLQSLINMMHGDCLVRTPMRPWSPRLCDSEVHNDSGISPGRSSSIAPSTSPQSPCIIRGSPEQYPDSPADSSRHFRGSPNSPSLPERYPRISNPTSPNSNGLPGDSSFRDSSNHAFSPYHTDSSPPGPADSSLERLKMALERSTALAGVYKTEDDGKDRDQAENAARKEFPCPLCAYTTPYRHRYMEHVSTHYSDKCTLCDFKGQNVIELRTHLSEAHGVTEGDLSDLADPTDQPDSTPDGPEDDENPRRGKSKHFRCKQCTFVTTTKVDFWEHTKTHIKAEKLLTCPKCPFVTEYKHHLEYHLRNHFGSKPFKCNKCSYSCVNKSMLNSHLKSHSNVYQYRCADCAYATKYCHSLKLHLRKYDHNPAVVLNQDGSPNPLPIIDVYGTRRGPKQKPKPAEDCEKSSLPGGIVVPPAPHGMQHAEEVRPKLMGCNLCEFYTGSMEILNQHMYAHATESPFAHMFRTNNNLPDQGAIKDYLQTMMISMEPPASPLSLVSPHHSPMAFQPASPLDLSKSEPESRDEQRPRDERKNRRKGKAYKLERPRETKPMQVDEPICMVKRETTPEKSSSVDEELMGGKYNGSSNGAFDFSVSNQAAVVQSDKDGTRHESNHTNPSPPALNPYDLCETKLDEPQQDFKVRITSVDIKQERMGEPEETQVNGDKSDAEGYTCDYCDMAFKDVVMYTMHMGYHGYRNPFTCNMCGHETTNRVSFFLHIARQSHT